MKATKKRYIDAEIPQGCGCCNFDVHLFTIDRSVSNAKIKRVATMLANSPTPEQCLSALKMPGFDCAFNVKTDDEIDNYVWNVQNGNVF